MQIPKTSMLFKVDKYLVYNLSLTDSISCYIDTVCLECVCQATMFLSDYLFERLTGSDKNTCLYLFVESVKQTIHNDLNKSVSIKTFFQRMLTEINLDRLIFITLEYYFEHIFKPVYRRVREHRKLTNDFHTDYVVKYFNHSDKQILISVFKKEEVQYAII